ncbi:MAG TPA: cupin domain-containing protein, partial [Candidatus Binatia bacterium]
VLPHIWKWDDVYGMLKRAGEVMNLDDAGRRTLRLINPGLKDRHFTTHTIHLSIQYVKPGEHAGAHRHTMAAFRFVIMGHGAYTTVNGRQCVMEEGDLILTPQMTWHDHSGGEDGAIVWLDGLDFPLVQSLNQLVFESYGKPVQAIQQSSEQVAPLFRYPRPAGACAGDFFHYKWPDTEAALRARVKSSPAPDPFDGYPVEFRNPATGGPTLPTLQCALQLLKPGQETQVHRHTSTVIYHAFKGRGSTLVGDRRYDWARGDSFVVPVWYAHGHRNGSAKDDAMLFSVSDGPVLKSLGLYREEGLKT